MDGSSTMSKAIALPFSFTADGGVNSTQDLKKIIQDRVVLVIMTQVGERINRLKYGTSVKKSLFENTEDAANIIKDEVATGFNLWLNYLTLINVDPVVDPLDGHISINITYRYGSASNPETVVVKTDILSQSGDVLSEVPNVK
jgi:phage baseplate assembly protein W